MNLRFEFPKSKEEAIESIVDDLIEEMREVTKKPPTKPNMVAYTIAWVEKIKDIKHILKAEL